jgi:hypothetical protein
MRRGERFSYRGAVFIPPALLKLTLLVLLRECFLRAQAGADGVTDLPEHAASGLALAAALQDGAVFVVCVAASAPLQRRQVTPRPAPTQHSALLRV